MTPKVTCVLELRGDVDLESTLDIRARMQDALDARANVVRIDTSQTAFLDCAGLDVLLWCMRRGRRAGVRVEIVRPSAAVQRVMAATATRRMFPLAA